jgi:hypothetical protein
LDLHPAHPDQYNNERINRQTQGETVQEEQTVKINTETINKKRIEDIKQGSRIYKIGNSAVSGNEYQRDKQ